MLISTATSRSTSIEVLAHRGWWSREVAGNSLPALQAALEAGYGLETDIRDSRREIVVAHDPPDESRFELAELLSIYRDLACTSCLALNIKSCGLAPRLASLLAEFEIQNYFAFDMSIPDLLHYERAGVRFFTRQSEIEMQPALYQAAAGVWLDAFHSEWYDGQTIERHPQSGKDVCVVSPELHRRDPSKTWDALMQLRTSGQARLQICTDHPDQFVRV
jgi:glycerophosphoryl diester phosphodiesterase